jgi:hypothetical protein
MNSTGPGWAGRKKYKILFAQTPKLFIMRNVAPGSVPDSCKPGRNCKVAAKQEHQSQDPPACACRLQPWLHLIVE